MKSEEDRQAAAKMAKSGVGARSTKQAKTSLEAALAKHGFKHTPVEEKPAEVSSAFLYFCALQRVACGLLSTFLTDSGNTAGYERVIVQ